MVLKTLNFRIITIVGMILLTACANNNEMELLGNQLTTNDVASAVLADDILATIDVVLEDDDNDFNLVGKQLSYGKSSIAPCVVRSVETNPIEETKTITLDFGEGCVGKVGRKFAGKIVIIYRKTDTGYSKSVTFVDLLIDDIQLNGTKSVTMVKENVNGNKEFKYTTDVSLIFDSGEKVTLEGTRIREKIEGDATLLRGDDVYLISGNWKFINKNEVVFTGEIIEKLRRSYACKFVISGVTEITKNGDVYSLDFGDGSCDNKAILTNANGESKTISLRGK